MNELRAAAERALTELRGGIKKHAEWVESLHTGIHNAVDILVAALAAEQPQPVGTVVASVPRYVGGIIGGKVVPWTEKPSSSEAMLFAPLPLGTMLYADPPPPAADPITDAMVEAALEAMHGAPVEYMFAGEWRDKHRAKMRAALAAAAKERGR